jgi:hypothetical protein
MVDFLAGLRGVGRGEAGAAVERVGENLGMQAAGRSSARLCCKHCTACAAPQVRDAWQQPALTPRA